MVNLNLFLTYFDNYNFYESMRQKILINRK